MKLLYNLFLQLPLILILIYPVGSVYSAGEDNSGIVTKLKNFGFENIVILIENDACTISYENRIFRDEIEAIEKILELTADDFSEYNKLILVPRNLILPICTIEFELEKYFAFLSREIPRDVFIESVNYSLDTDTISKELKKIERENKSELKTDILIYPSIKTRHGDYEKLLQVQAGLNPTVHTTLSRGISIFAQAIIPVYDNLIDDSNFIRPGILAFNSLFRLPSNIFMSTTVGQFANVDRYGIKYEHRYGIDWEIKKYFANGIWALGVNMGYTGESSYKDQIWKFMTMNTFTYFINAGYRIEKYNLRIAAKYGQYIYEDNSLRLDVSRQFGEVEIGFYTILSEDMKNGGFNLSIPLFPSKYYNSVVRVLPPKYFRYEYRAKRLPRQGHMYETGYDVDDFFKLLTQDYVKNYLFR
ncbi:YjbH domain-containing protein [Bacteroidota bacterium]